MAEQGAVILQNEVGNVEARELTDEEQWAIEHEKMHKLHQGHDKMHSEMMLILIISIIVFQLFLIQWKRRHFKSYQFCTLVGMWLIPLYISIVRQWTRFVNIWAVFTLLSCFIWYKAAAPQISGNTPRFVYKVFLFLHKLSYALGVAGYLMMMSALLNLNVIIGVTQNNLMDCGVLVMFYGLYYGVLGRDFARICTDRIASKIGYYTPEGLPNKNLEEGVCAICNLRLDLSAVTEHDSETSPVLITAENEQDEENNEKTYKLACGHVFHEFCIRGWIVVGKSQTCPYCKEKVDLQRMFKNPWEKPHIFYGQLLDWIRYLVCWQPLIVSFVQAVNHYLGLE